MKPGKMTDKSKVLGFDNCFNISRNSMRGNLAMLWSSYVNVAIASYSNQHIDTIVQRIEGMKWRCTGVYGHPENSKK